MLSVCGKAMLLCGSHPSGFCGLCVMTMFCLCAVYLCLCAVYVCFFLFIALVILFLLFVHMLSLCFKYVLCIVVSLFYSHLYFFGRFGLHFFPFFLLFVAPAVQGVEILTKKTLVTQEAVTLLLGETNGAITGWLGHS